MRVLQQRLGDGGAVVQGPAVEQLALNVPDVHHHIKRAAGHAAAEARNGVDQLHNFVAALLVGAAHLLHAALIHGKGHGGGVLGGGVGAGGGVGLVLDHGADHIARAAGIADAQAGHGVGLADAVDEDGVPLDGGAEAGDGVVARIAVDQLFVNLIGNDVEIVLHGQVGQLLQLLARPHAAVGVGGGVEHKGLGARRDALFQILHPGQKALRLRAVEKHRAALGHAHHLGIAYPAGLIHNHLVAGVEDGLKRVVQRVLGAVGYDNLIHLVAQAVVVEHAVGDGRAQLQRAGHGGVTGLAAIQRILEGLAHHGRRIKIRFACGKADHIHPLRTQRLGFGIHGQGGGRGNGAAALGNLGRHNGNPPVEPKIKFDG